MSLLYKYFQPCTIISKYPVVSVSTANPKQKKLISLHRANTNLARKIPLEDDEHTILPTITDSVALIKIMVLLIS